VEHAVVSLVQVADLKVELTPLWKSSMRVFISTKGRHESIYMHAEMNEI
jgi:hypothetical protein